MSNMGQVIMVVLAFVGMTGWNIFLVVSCLWNHAMPSLAQSLFSVITVLVMYIVSSYRD